MTDTHKQGQDPARSRKTIQVSPATHRKLTRLVQASQGSTSIGYAVDMLVATTSDERFFSAAEEWWRELRKGAQTSATKPEAGGTEPAASRQP